MLETYTGFNLNPSRRPLRPTIVICAPQGYGKTLFGEAISLRFQTTSVFDDGTINGVSVDPDLEFPSDGGLVMGTEFTGGDLEIIAHSPAGFDALIAALGIPLEHRPPYSKDFVRGPGASQLSLIREQSRSNTASAISGEAFSSNTD